MAQSRDLSLFLFLLLFLFTCSFTYTKSLEYDEDELEWPDDEISTAERTHSSHEACDYTEGKWVYDQSYPLYDSGACPYLSSAVSCRENGRPDSDYEKWRWKPDGCSIPRFNALDFLGKMRRKRIMLVGDSITRNQWESLVCLVQSVVPTARKTVIYNGPTMAFLALDYEMSIEFCWAPLLVELRKEQGKRILHLDLIEDNAKHWRGVDVLMFDSAHWWSHSEKWCSWDLVMEGNTVYKDINPTIAYWTGLTTWAKWIDLNLDPTRTIAFFRSMSPRHNRENGWSCHNQKEPLKYSSRAHVPEQLAVLQKVVRRMRFPVRIQNITSMTALRRDGHPSVYGRQKKEQQLKDLRCDCSHWCLPGVPDAWNELLNAMLI